MGFVLRTGLMELILWWVGAPVSLYLVVRTAATSSQTPDRRGSDRLMTLTTTFTASLPLVSQPRENEGLSVRTYTPKPHEVECRWHVIDATDVVLGRLASQTAILLRGKHKTTFAPHVDGGDFVVIINADKVALTGSKLVQKKAYHHSGFPGGLKATSYQELLAKQPAKAVEKAVRGMLPHTSLARQQMNKLKVYAGAQHPHQAQKPVPFEITQVAQ
jgi:large subunit ribosomal protein L13